MRKAVERIPAKRTKRKKGRCGRLKSAAAKDNRRSQTIGDRDIGEDKTAADLLMIRQVRARRKARIEISSLKLNHGGKTHE